MFRRLSEMKLKRLRDALERETDPARREELQQDVSMAEAALRVEQRVKERTRR